MGLTTNYGISVLEQRLKELQLELTIIYDQLDQLQSDQIVLKNNPETWEEVRIKRNLLLKNSDWTMTTGCTVDQREWSKYRQILRDIPQVFKSVSPDKINWPLAPSIAGPNTTPVE
jgi:hypothetical protein